MLETLGIDMPTAFLLVLAVGLALSFEFVNGFHDTGRCSARACSSSCTCSGFTESGEPWHVGA